MAYPTTHPFWLRNIWMVPNPTPNIIFISILIHTSSHYFSYIIKVKPLMDSSKGQNISCWKILLSRCVENKKEAFQGQFTWVTNNFYIFTLTNYPTSVLHSFCNIHEWRKNTFAFQRNIIHFLKVTQPFKAHSQNDVKRVSK